jgi:CubicO group peptidase (beta-lactamase class C family)
MLHLLTFVALSLSTGAPPDTTRIDKLVEQALQDWDVPGAAVVIVNRDGVVHLKGYGVRELNGKPVTPDTIFPLASCSKAFTTTLIAALADDGKLKWDDHVSKHLPDFHLSNPHADALVTLRDLASHRTGLAGHDTLWYRSPWSQEELIRRVGKLPLTRPFRTEMQYQTIMYVAAGHAAARVGEKPWDALLRERLLEPLGMQDVELTTTAAEKHTNRAAGHRSDKDGKLKIVPWYPQPVPNPAGSVHATARDLGVWLRFHLNDGTHNGQQIISAAGARELRMPQIVVRFTDATRALNPETQQISYGLGWVIQDYRGKMLVMHAGLIDGFRAHLTILPKNGYAFAILANREGTRMNLALSNSLVDQLLGLPAKDWNKYLLEVIAEEEAEAKRQRRQEDLSRKGLSPSVELDKLAGEYEDPAYGTATVKLQKDHLEFQWGGWKIPLEHFDADQFRLAADEGPLKGVMVRFVVTDGRPIEFRAQGVTFRRKEK